MIWRFLLWLKSLVVTDSAINCLLCGEKAPYKDSGVIRVKYDSDNQSFFEMIICGKCSNDLEKSKMVKKNGTV